MTGNRVAEAVIIAALPIAIFFGGVWVMSKLSGYPQAKERFLALPQQDRKPLNQRLHYDVAAVQRRWEGLQEAVQVERRLLEVDLVFPLLYCAAFVTSLVWAWASLGRPIHPAWLLAPVVITLLADWTENLVLLDQLRRYLAVGAPALQAGWIRIASLATALKLLFFSGTTLAIWGLAGQLLRQAFKP